MKPFPTRAGGLMLGAANQAEDEPVDVIERT